MSNAGLDLRRDRWKWRWWQLSLRGLFALITVCAVGAWWYGQPEVVEEYYENGALKTRAEVIRTDKNSIVQNGRWIMRDEAGQILVSGKYRAGKPDGWWKYWHSNGQPAAEGRFVDGKMDGRWTQWDQHGRKRFAGEYEQGRLHGAASAWWDTGQLASDGRYETGKRTGEWSYWDRSGKEYSHGLKVSSQ